MQLIQFIIILVFDTTYTQSSVKHTNIIFFNQIYAMYNNFNVNIYIYMKYILYTQILQDIIFNDTFQILISQILYQYTKLHINAILGIKSIHNSISQIFYQYTKLHINATLGIKSIHNSISQILKDNSIQFELNQKKNYCKVTTNNFFDF